MSPELCVCVCCVCKLVGWWERTWCKFKCKQTQIIDNLNAFNKYCSVTSYVDDR